MKIHVLGAARGYTTSKPCMAETYGIPVLALLGALLAVFAALYARLRTTRSLLWLLGWIMTALQLGFLQLARHPYGLMTALADTTIQLAVLLFMGSLSPLRFPRFRIPYVAAYAVPLILFCFLSAYLPHPSPIFRWLMMGGALATVAIAISWSTRRNLLPPWFTILFTAAVGGLCLYSAWTGHYVAVRHAALAGASFITTLLVIAEYRRCTPGVCFTAAGLLMWCVPAFIGEAVVSPNAPWSVLLMTRAFNLAKIIAAIGMIVLMLEDELLADEEAKRRTLRSHRELEHYSRLHFSLPSSQDLSSTYEPLCQVVAACSPFAQAALLLREADGRFRLAATAGLGEETVRILELLSPRFDQHSLRPFSDASGQPFDLGQAQRVDLAPLLLATELPRTDFLHPYGMTLRTRNGRVDGLLLLSQLKCPKGTIGPADLLPLELLLARFASARQHHSLVRHLAQSDRLASLGQLAGGVAHELNNPLTVVMGYAELLLENDPRAATPSYASIILTESRRMKQIIESLSRFWRPSAALLAELRIEQLLRDLHKLYGPSLSRKGIRLELEIAPALPPVLANSDQLQQVLLQILNRAATSLEEVPAEAREISIDLRSVGGAVQILIADSGPGFTDPERVFDPFYSGKTLNEDLGSGMGLSLCYTVIREHGGEIVAYNHEPRGAAILIQLPACHPSPLPLIASELITP